MKDIDSTSGSGQESYYTPEPSPTDSSSSGGLNTRVCVFEIIHLIPYYNYSRAWLMWSFQLISSMLCICVSADKPVMGSTPVFEFIDPDVQVRLLVGF